MNEDQQQAPTAPTGITRGDAAVAALNTLGSITGRTDLTNAISSHMVSQDVHVANLTNTADEQAGIIKNLEAELAVGLIKYIFMRLLKKFRK